MIVRDSSMDDAHDEDEDDEEEEEEHLAPSDSAIATPIDEPVFPPEGTEPVILPPSTDITIGARITVRPQTSISLPPEAEVERLLTMTTPSPSPPISLSPPSAEERLARCTAPPAHSPPLSPSSGCLTQIQTLRIASTQALIDAVTAALPPPPLPPLPPSLYIPPPVDRRDDIPESEQPPRKRLHLSTLGSRYEIGEKSFLTCSDLPEVEETVWMVEEEEAYASREAWAHSIGLIQATHQELQTHRDHVYAHETYLQAHQTQLQLQSTLIQTQHQAELLALREQRGRARQPGPEARIPDHQEASGDADRAEGVVGLTRWIEKMESVFHISGCAIENQVKFTTCTLLGAALTWWNGQIRTLGPEAYAMTWEVLKKKMTDKYCPHGEIKKLEIEL
ncbi:hypothetical protein Tco_0556016 [Tanacetum coccineum]